MQRSRVVLAVVAVLAWHGRAAAVPDRVEALQTRTWAKRGALTLAPVAQGAFNDPFVWRGGLGLRVTAWPRSILGFSLAGTYEAQTPSGDAEVAQRELRARLRPAATAWSAIAAAEAGGVDGKLAFGSAIVPFELLLRAGAGLCGVGGVANGAPSLAFSAGLGARWFLSPALGLETTLAWRSASVARSVGGRDVAARDTVVSLELALPLRFGGDR